MICAERVGEAADGVFERDDRRSRRSGAGEPVMMRAASPRRERRIELGAGGEVGDDGQRHGRLRRGVARRRRTAPRSRPSPSCRRPGCRRAPSPARAASVRARPRPGPRYASSGAAASRTTARCSSTETRPSPAPCCVAGAHALTRGRDAASHASIPPVRTDASIPAACSARAARSARAPTLQTTTTGPGPARERDPRGSRRAGS